MAISIRVKKPVIKKLGLLSYSNDPVPEKIFPPSPYYRFLKSLCEYYNPDLSVELGVAGGGGSYYMCLGSQNGLVVGIDIALEYPENIGYVRKNCDNFEFVRKDSIEGLWWVYEQYGSPDIIFIDTTHEYERTKNEYETSLHIINKPGIICLDDLNRESVFEYWQGINEPKIDLSYLHERSPGGGGFGVTLVGC